MTLRRDSMQASGVVRAATSRAGYVRSKAHYRSTGTSLASRALQFLFNTPWRFNRDGQDNCSSSGRGVRRGGGRLVGAIEWKFGHVGRRDGQQLEQRVDELTQLDQRFDELAELAELHQRVEHDLTDHRPQRPWEHQLQP